MELPSLPPLTAATSIDHIKFKLVDLFKSILNGKFLIHTYFFVLIVGVISFQDFYRLNKRKM